MTHLLKTEHAALSEIDSQIQILQYLINTSGIILSPEKSAQLTEYTRLIIRRGTRSNLISQKDLSRIAERHIFESLLLTKAADFTGKIRILDMGAGAGFPGLPLKIWNPEIELCIIESVNKKCRFIEYVIESLHLDSITLRSRRIEEAMKETELLGMFDIVTARALAPLRDLFSLAEPFLRHDGTSRGMCVFPKGEHVREEIEQTDRTKWDISVGDFTHFLAEHERKTRNLFVVSSLLTIT
ncbi:16S rRNA (guanine(527)-N(7))-methyltransferase RsmG [candidate division KSB1 bacterium]